MKHSNKITALLLSALMLSSSVSLFSCASNNENKEEEKAASPDTGTIEEAAAEETEAEYEHDKVPEIDFGGCELRMAGQANHPNNNMDMWVAELTGDVVLDSIYNRKIYVEDRLNIRMAEPFMGTFGECSDVVLKSVKSGTDEFDIVVNQLAQSSSDVLTRSFLNLNDIEYIDFERSWYPNEIVESASLNGKLLLIMSDMCLTYVGCTQSIAFDADDVKNYGIENLYDVVREGRWTWDKLYSLASDVYLDKNGNGIHDEDDYYGFTFGSSFSGCLASEFVYGAGQRFFEIDDNFEIVNLLGSERAVNLAEKITAIMNAPGYLKYEPSYQFIGLMDDHYLFVPSGLVNYYLYARDFEGTFGVLPLPKYDEEQEGYYSVADAGCNCITIPVTCSNTELAGASIEVMSSYSHNFVNPAYVDVSLQTKVARDPESAEMIDVVLNGRVMDFAYLYCGWSGWTWQLGEMFPNADTYMSVYTKKLKVMNKTYEKIMKMFLEE